jgi:hypothetical protein
MITGQEIVDDARRYLGVPYKLNGRASDGLDCMGIVMLIASDFGFHWECETPKMDQDGVLWEDARATLKVFGFRQMPLSEAKLGDLIVLRVPLGGVATVKIISGLGGLASFFGISRFINYLETTGVLLETSLSTSDMIGIKRTLKMDVQDYTKKLWRCYRYPFVG